MSNKNKSGRSIRIVAWIRGALLLAALLLGVFGSSAFAEPVWENGEYLIYNSADLEIMSGWVNNATASADLKYRLMEDIDIGGSVSWLPIGAFQNAPFNGEFNGGGHAITNFLIVSDLYQVGLFGIVSGDAKISNISVLSFDVYGYGQVGGLVGYNYNGTISNSSASGISIGNNEVGGLVGYNYSGKISTSYATGEVKGASARIGGLVGGNDINGTIITCYANGPVDGFDETGGLVGRNFGTISTSFSKAEVNGNYEVGGLVGHNEGSISISYTNAKVIGSIHIGGIAGVNHDNGIISTSYACGTIGGLGNLGCLVGYNSGGTIDNSYWMEGLYKAGIGYDNGKSATMASLDLAGVSNRASFDYSSWHFYGDTGVQNPDWCYSSFDKDLSPFGPALFVFFDPASAPNFDRINGDFIHLIPQSMELHANEVKKLQLKSPGYNNLPVKDFNLSTLNSSGSSITIESSGTYKAILSIDEQGIITVSADSELFKNASVETLIISVDHNIGTYPQAQKAFRLSIVPDYKDSITPVISITAQPISTTVTRGSISGGLSVSASVTEGAALTYQWYRSSTNSNTGGTEINGATSASFTIPSDLSVGTYYYYCVVSAVGAASVSSNAATITVDEDTGCKAGYGSFALILLGIVPFVFRKK